jgi:predicted kinase
VLTPRLPARFESTGQRSGGRLIVVCGVPGTGKSTLADGIGRALGIPVFAIDWLMGALTPFGGRDRGPELGDIGYELATTLAYRQLLLGQSAVIDSPAEGVDERERWRTLAESFDAGFDVIHCVCGDEATHATRLATRVRGIAGWHDGGSWQVVKPRRDAWVPWTGVNLLELDAVHGADENLARALRWL